MLAVRRLVLVSFYAFNSNQAYICVDETVDYVGKGHEASAFGSAATVLTGLVALERRDAFAICDTSITTTVGDIDLG